MYYTSNDIQEIEAYNTLVTQGEGYNGTTTKWADVITHKDGNQFAIIKHPDFITQMNEVETLDGWFETQL